MEAALIAVISVLGTTLTAITGAFASGVWTRRSELDKLQTVLDVKLEVIATQKETIQALTRNNLLLEAAAQGFNTTMATLKAVVSNQGGGS